MGSLEVFRPRQLPGGGGFPKLEVRGWDYRQQQENQEFAATIATLQVPGWPGEQSKTLSQKEAHRLIKVAHTYYPSNKTNKNIQHSTLA